MQFAAAGEHPRRRRLPERLNHVAPAAQFIRIEDRYARPLAADQADIRAALKPLGDRVGVAGDLPARAGRPLLSRAQTHTFPVAAANGCDGQFGVGVHALASNCATSPCSASTRGTCATALFNVGPIGT